MTNFSGSGPGPQTIDGCSVELYARLPYRGELDAVIACINPGSTVLELGCGAGRGAQALLDAGLKVTAVDNSQEMLDHCPPLATRVLSEITTLNLNERFSAVVLPTGLIDHHDVAVRAAFVACARRHTEDNGWFFIERQDPKWLRTAAVGSGGHGEGLGMSIDRIDRCDQCVSMTLRYFSGSDTWIHSFKLSMLEENDLQELLSQAGFGQIHWLNESRIWLKVQVVAPRA